MVVHIIRWWRSLWTTTSCLTGCSNAALYLRLEQELTVNKRPLRKPEISLWNKDSPNFDSGENEQGDIQRESERAEAAWKDGHVSLIQIQNKIQKPININANAYDQTHSRMKHKRLVNAVKCDETVQRRQVSEAAEAHLIQFHVGI